MRTARLPILVVVILLALGTLAEASVPAMINYQGKLMRPDGTPVTDGIYSITFTIYDAETGGNVRWSEPDVSVHIKGGLFSVLLGGNGTNLPANIFDDADRWFGIKVNSDPEMVPRQKIASVAYANKAASADTAAAVPDGSITASKLATGLAVPPGTIVMWCGTQIPQGWALCNGQNGTPNLRNQFIVGAGDEYQVGATGGEKNHRLTVPEMPNHSHGVNDPGHGHTAGVAIGWGTAGPNAGWGRLDTSGGHPGQGWATWVNASSTGIWLSNSGGDQAHENRPPYYALCFIMKLAY